jgi:hypothetical protein
MKIVDGGPAAVNVTDRFRFDVVTVNGWTSFPPTATVPLNVSVVATGVGAGAGVADAGKLVPPLEQPAAASAIPTPQTHCFITTSRFSTWSVGERDN